MKLLWVSAQHSLKTKVNMTGTKGKAKSERRLKMLVRFRYSEDFGNKSVDIMDLSNKAKRTLARLHVKTMEDVLKNWDNFVRIKGAGEKTISEIKIAFTKAYGESLTDEEQIAFLERIVKDNTPVVREEAV